LVRAVYIAVINHATKKGNKSIVAFLVLLRTTDDNQICGMKFF
jgi:hypothetical protein